jgi:hypothetical protein
VSFTLSIVIVIDYIYFRSFPFSNTSITAFSDEGRRNGQGTGLILTLMPEGAKLELIRKLMVASIADVGSDQFVL